MLAIKTFSWDILVLRYASRLTPGCLSTSGGEREGGRRQRRQVREKGREEGRKGKREREKREGGEREKREGGELQKGGLSEERDRNLPLSP